MLHPIARVLVLASVVVLSGIAGGASAGDLERGKALHDTFCVGCHGASVYTRQDRVANTYGEILQQVARWQGNTQWRWSQQDIESVADYLAVQFYKAPN